jgi:glycosyltransferase involved in cell wall biosynthesis
MPQERARSATPRVLVLGRLVPHKRVEHVLRAAALLRDRITGLRVSIVGDGWWRDEVVAEATRLAITDIVEFHGFVDDDTKQSELQRAWVLALPSLKEGWGLAITEAASHGVPSIAYRSAGGVAESIRDLESGLLVDGGEADFTSALHRVLTDAPLRQRLSEGAADRALSLSWQATAESFARVLSEVTGLQIRTGWIESESALRQPGARTAGLERM